MDIQQASIYSGLSEQTLRRWIVKRKKLPATKINGKYDILASDLDALMVQPAPDTLSERIASLESRMLALEGLQQQQPTRRAQAQASDTLPEGLAPIRPLIKQYNLKETTVMNAMRPYLKKGNWKLSGHAVNNALDAEGVAEFMRRYGGKSEG